MPQAIALRTGRLNVHERLGGNLMALIETVETGLYRIPLTVSLSDSTHGKIEAFEELSKFRVYGVGVVDIILVQAFDECRRCTGDIRKVFHEILNWRK